MNLREARGATESAPTRRSGVTVVIPCFDEEKRLPVARLQDFAREVSLLFVNDGSRDNTGALLERMCGDGIEMVSLERNSGKGEAVRRGLLRAIEDGAEIVAFADSDLATPPEEILRVVEEVRSGRADVALASRVALAGTNIRRRAVRHFLGRLFATGASLALHARFYDTQCGAKAFRVTPALRAALAAPFGARWVFDIELLGRLLDRVAPDRFVEVPLREWQDVAGSKLKSTAMAVAALDLARVAWRRRGTRSKMPGRST
jgi:glycosyltransferase involved in cell wall biosynthesis